MGDTAAKESNLTEEVVTSGGGGGGAVQVKNEAEVIHSEIRRW